MDNIVPNGSLKRSAAEATIEKYRTLFGGDVGGINTNPAAALWQTMALSHLIAQDLEGLLSESALRAADMRVLAVILIEVDAVPSPTEIARILSITPAAVTLRLKHLTAEGLIMRTADGQDKRRVRLALTDLGRDIVIDYLAKAGSQSAFSRAFTRLSDDERLNLEDMLSRLNQEMERYIKIG